MLIRNEIVPVNFPLVLIVGREPNNTTESDGSIGNIPFEEKGIDAITGKKYNNQKCAFWNIAFGLLGSTKEIKKMISEKLFCPIVFTRVSEILRKYSCKFLSLQRNVMTVNV